MKVHEHQAKELLARYGVAVAQGRVVTTPEEARRAAQELGRPVVLKAQVHAGGRGKGGGIRLAATPEEAEEAARGLLGRRLVTPQTGPDGKPVGRLLVEEQVAARRELYLGVVIDNAAGWPLLMASQAGGVEIEEVAARSPEAIHRAAIDPALGLRPYQAREMAFALGLGGERLGPATAIMMGLYRLFWEKSCSLAEINPLVEAEDGRLLALDAKVSFDDNALFRHPEIAALRDQEQEDALEVQAQALGISNYVKLSGNIGCVVNGAGLAMATMDAIKLEGGEPANFLDIGTVNGVERIVNSFRLLIADPQVEAILINIFGGMARVDIIAQGTVEAFRQMEVRVPVVVRLAGTNAEAGEAILGAAALPLRRARDFGEAARMAVAAAAERRR